MEKRPRKIIKIFRPRVTDIHAYRAEGDPLDHPRAKLRRARVNNLLAEGRAKRMSEEFLGPEPE